MEGPYIVYILLCADNTFYTGISSNIKNRLASHQAGLACTYTKFRRPVKLVFIEKHRTLSRAAKRELQIKGWSRHKKILLIKGLLF